jgi:hypothetical protein|tara:strand:+ start:2607 stop:3611 length:1005 start_codon:yes stop_codon:yes gene_type:complete
LDKNKIKRDWRNWESQQKQQPNEPKMKNPQGSEGEGGLNFDRPWQSDSDAKEGSNPANKLNPPKYRAKESKSKGSKKNYDKIVKFLSSSEKDENEYQWQRALDWQLGLEGKNYIPNEEEVEAVFNPYEKTKNRRLASNLATIISKIAEDRIGEPVIGEDEWDMSELMMRSVTKRNIYRCKHSRDRERIVLILDASPSCSDLSSFYGEIGFLSSKLGCLEIFVAPNAVLTHKLDVKTGEYFTLFKNNGSYDIEAIECGAAYMHNYFSNRVILYFGDLDGVDLIMKASMNNELHYFNKSYFDAQDDFYAERILIHSSRHYECSSTEDLIKITKKMR